MSKKNAPAKGNDRGPAGNTAPRTSPISVQVSAPSRSSGGGAGQSSGGKGGGSTIKVAGQSFNVGKTFGAGDIAKIQAAIPTANLSQIQQKVQGKNITIGSGAKDTFKAAATAAAQAQSQAQADTTRELIESVLDDRGFGSASPLSEVPEGYVTDLEYEAGLDRANLEMQRQIEQLRQLGQTERQKLVNENNLAVTGMEVKGKLDLQGIVNAGYKNIANIERGTNMFSSIMGAFNF